VLDESSRWQDDPSFIVMFRFDYGATGNRRRATAEPKPLEDAALREADKPTRWWWSFLFLVSARNLVLWQCLSNSPLSSIFVGRSVATIAELSFAGQCALFILKLSALTGNASLQVVARAGATGGPKPRG
jgi:hypothetical protein